VFIQHKERRKTEKKVDKRDPHVLEMGDDFEIFMKKM
jgi:hypothetical protein